MKKKNDEHKKILKVKSKNEFVYDIRAIVASQA